MKTFELQNDGFLKVSAFEPALEGGGGARRVKLLYYHECVYFMQPQVRKAKDLDKGVGKHSTVMNSCSQSAQALSSAELFLLE